MTSDNKKTVTDMSITYEKKPDITIQLGKQNKPVTTAHSNTTAQGNLIANELRKQYGK